MSKSGENQDEKKKPQQASDPFQRLKNIAYARSQTPRGVDIISYADFVDYAKHQLCKARNRLWKDPVWESYHDVEILVEFFTLCFDDNPDLRKEFVRSFEGSEYNKGIDWMKDQISRNNEQSGLGTKESKDEFVFTPAELGEE